jgi:hypothetical protein
VEDQPSEVDSLVDSFKVLNVEPEADGIAASSIFFKKRKSKSTKDKTTSVYIQSKRRSYSKFEELRGLAQ